MGKPLEVQILSGARVKGGEAILDFESRVRVCALIPVGDRRDRPRICRTTQGAMAGRYGLEVGFCGIEVGGGVEAIGFLKVS